MTREWAPKRMSPKPELTGIRLGELLLRVKLCEKVREEHRGRNFEGSGGVLRWEPKRLRPAGGRWGGSGSGGFFMVKP